MPIDRAQMRVRMVLPQKDARRLRERVAPMLVTIEREEWSGDLEIVRASAIVTGGDDVR